MNNAALVFSRSDTALVVNPSSAVSGSGSLGFVGGGTGMLTIASSNTYTGPTTVNGGTLQIGKGGTGAAIGGTSGVTLLNNASLVFNHADNVNFTPAISGSGSLTKNGSGTLTLTAPSTYSGATIIQSGTLKLALTAMPSGVTPELWLDAAAGTITTSGGTVSQWNSSAGTMYATGVGGPTLIANALNGHPVVDMSTYGSGQWMNWNKELTDIRTVFWVFGSQNGGGFLLGDTPSSKYDFHRGGSPTGNVASTPIWSSPYANAAIQGGTTDIFTPGATLGTMTGGTVNGTTTGLSGGYQLLDLTTTASVTASNLANDRSIGGRQGGQRIGEMIVFNTALTNAQRVAVDQYLDAKWFGVGPLPSTTPVTLAPGATLDLGGLNQTIGALADVNGSSGTVTNSGGYASMLTVGNDNSTATFSGVIASGTSPTGLGKVGSGVFTLPTAQPYTGVTQISGGTLQLGNGGTTGSIDSTSGVVATGGILAFNRSDSSLTFAPPISGAGGVWFSGPGMLSLTGSNTFGGPLTISSGTVALGAASLLGGGAYGGAVAVPNGGALILNNSGNQTLSGLISGSGAGPARQRRHHDLHGGKLLYGRHRRQRRHTHLRRRARQWVRQYPRHAERQSRSHGRGH